MGFVTEPEVRRRALRSAFGALLVGSGVGEAAPSQAGGSGGASAPRTPRRTAEVDV
jgi:hypothetical protein